MIALALVVLLWAPPSNEAAERAERHFAAGEYEAAIVALEQAYAIEPDRAFVFAMGSAWQALGECEKATEQYERFLGTDPSAEQAASARERIALCRPRKPPPPLVVAPPPASAEPMPAEPTRPADRRADDARPWHRDPAGGVLLGLGLAVAVGGTALEIAGATRRLGADDASGEQDFRRQLRQSNTMQGVGIGMIASGTALVLGAVIRYALVRRGRVARTR